MLMFASIRLSFDYCSLDQSQVCQIQRYMPTKQSTIRNSRSQSCSSIESSKHQDKLFKKKLQSIREYMNLLQDDPQKAFHFETQCEKNFYKTELKAAIAINFSLVKLVQDKENEICSLLAEIRQQRKHINRSISPQKTINDENSQLQANRTALTPKQHIKRAFEAQKQIIGAKYSQQKEEYRKKLERKEEMLKSSKQQNLFLRQKLIEMGEKMTLLQQQNEQFRRQARGIQKANSIIVPECQNKIHPRVLNFSPIHQREEDNKISIEEISFNQTPEKNPQPSLFHSENKYFGYQNNKPQNVSKAAEQIRQTRYYEQLQRQYGELKEDMLEILKEVQRYRSIMKQIQIHYQDKVTYRQQVSQIISKPIDQLQTKNEHQFTHQKKGKACIQCLKLQNIKEQLGKELQKTREDLDRSKMKVERILALVRKHKEEWNVLLDDGEPMGND